MKNCGLETKIMNTRTNCHIKPDGKTYTIRKSGKVIVQSSLPACGYSQEELRSLREAGYKLYEDDKLVKK